MSEDDSAAFPLPYWVQTFLALEAINGWWKINAESMCKYWFMASLMPMKYGHMAYLFALCLIYTVKLEELGNHTQSNLQSYWFVRRQDWLSGFDGGEGFDRLCEASLSHIAHDPSFSLWCMYTIANHCIYVFDRFVKSKLLKEKSNELISFSKSKM